MRSRTSSPATSSPRRCRARTAGCRPDPAPAWVSSPIAGDDPTARPEHRFRAVWHNIFQHLAGDPIRARFLLQVDASPLAGMAHAAAVEDGEDPLLAVATAPDMAQLLVNLPLAVLYDLGFGAAIRLAARADGSADLVNGPATETLIDACWRAITRR